ncbi:MAG: isocitrate lyase/phosphoenolpyruvate mutase family protein [Thermomicrobiales bacterium]
MSRDEKLARFRELHERPGVFVIPNPWDAGSARILTALGFEALATTSGGYAFSIGGRDEIGELSRDGVLENAASIVAATSLPVSAVWPTDSALLPKRAPKRLNVPLRPGWSADRSRRDLQS